MSPKQERSGSGNGKQQGPKVGRPAKKDTSPPLHEQPPQPPRRGDTIREMPRPLPTEPAPDEQEG